MRNRKRPYAERTFSRNRTISARKSAGTKRPRNTEESTAEVFLAMKFNPTRNKEMGHLHAPPMNLGASSQFHNIEETFERAPQWRVMYDRAPLARRYT